MHPFVPNDVFQFLDGKYYTLDGIEGQFCHSYWYSPALYEWFEWLYHIPTINSRKTPAYQSLRNQLGDNWDTNLTNNIERYCAIAVELGYQYQPTDN